MDRLEELEEKIEANFEALEYAKGDYEKAIIYNRITALLLEQQKIYKQQLENLKRQIR